MARRGTTVAELKSDIAHEGHDEAAANDARKNLRIGKLTQIHRKISLSQKRIF